MTFETLREGDRVKVVTLIDDKNPATDIEEYRNSVVGNEGTVTHVPAREGALYDVEFDEPVGTPFKYRLHHFYRIEMERLH